MELQDSFKFLWIDCNSYNSIELKDEDTPDELEMEAMVWKKEEMYIHIVSDQHET